MRHSGEGLGSLLGGLVLYPQKLINVPVNRGFSWKDHPAITAALADAERGLDGRGRVLLRASGTEPLLRVMVEGEEAGEVIDTAERLAAIVRESAQ
jgi:phosphoglucosamine mutase